MSYINGTLKINGCQEVAGRLIFGGGGIPTTIVVSETSATLEVQAGTLIPWLIIEPSAAGSFSIGTTPGGAEIYSDVYTSGYYEPVNIGRYFPATTTLHLTGAFTLKFKPDVYA